VEKRQIRDGKHFRFNKAATTERRRAAGGGAAARKSLMNMDLDRLANEAQSRGEQHFSFTNATKDGQDTAKNKGPHTKGDALKIIKERNDSSNDSFRSDSQDSDNVARKKDGNTPGKGVSNL
jgi:hypothetical protein